MRRFWKGIEKRGGRKNISMLSANLKCAGLSKKARPTHIWNHALFWNARKRHAIVFQRFREAYMVVLLGFWKDIEKKAGRRQDMALDLQDLELTECKEFSEERSSAHILEYIPFHDAGKDHAIVFQELREAYASSC
jgi:hypothetical protein